MRRSYAASALAKPENQLAAVVTAVVALGVGLFSQVPLGTGLTADLTRPRERWGAVSASYIGFARPSEAGRRIRAAPARVSWNRPLPARFQLVVEARSTGAEPRPLEIAVGATRHRELVSPQGSRLRLSIEQDGRSREVRLTGDGIAVSRVGIEPPP
jgi:hypothetical protein